MSNLRIVFKDGSQKDIFNVEDYTIKEDGVIKISIDKKQFYTLINFNEAKYMEEF